MVETKGLFNYEYDVERIDELSVKGIVVALTKCLNCNTLFLTRVAFNFIEDFSWYGSLEQLYPVINSISKDAPDFISSPLHEAMKCYKIHAFEACVVICRKGIEAICTDKGENSGMLVNRLIALKESGVLEPTFYN